MGIILFIVGTIGWHVGMYGMFKKAGLEPWKAFVPFYNTWLIVEKCEIKKTWFWLQLIPIAGQFITIWITIIWVMHFKKVNLIAHTLTVFLPFIYFPYLGFSDKEKWYGKEPLKHYHKPVSREWIDAGVFAIVAATIIRSFVFEAYVIPTGSMEKTLRINDFLFVNKVAYGPRIPQTPLAFPFVHNFLPFSQTAPSYLKWIQLKYDRLPGYTPIKRNDVVVFNFPAGDTIINEIGYGSAVPYYDVLRQVYKGNREALLAEHEILVHPMDKTDNYIKRCVAIAGETIQIKEGLLYVNGEPSQPFKDAQTDYIVKTNGTGFTEEYLKNELNLWLKDDDNLEFSKLSDSTYSLNMRAEDAEKVKKLPFVTSIVRMPVDQPTYPYDTFHNWTTDNFGPLLIPKKGTVITLDPSNINLYKRAIENYEGNKFETVNGKYIINGKETTTYTFKYDYYWMMGDNRHRSQDSRYWGFVPETHVVGKASFIWFSWENGPRFSRIFKFIK
ncbi:signal peptidase I [Parasediminibacterium paludis]|uniref:Signal peptidase I n=1 Tax=Parasediminibacterium paludis TaxID=908966 RepID=A0ABV8PYA7_9BACT